MVFKRRNKLPILQRFRESVLPKRGWMRAVRYVGHRIKRLPDTPHRIALGLAIGIAISFSPFFGLHMVFGVLLARLFRANGLAGFLGTFFGNPLTFPFIVGLSFGLGRWITGASGFRPESGGVQAAFSNALIGLWNTIKSWFGVGQSEMERLVDFWHQFFLPYLIGGIIPGLAFGVAGYFVSRPLIQAYQNHRRVKMAEKKQII